MILGSFSLSFSSGIEITDDDKIVMHPVHFPSTWPNPTTTEMLDLGKHEELISVPNYSGFTHTSPPFKLYL